MDKSESKWPKKPTIKLFVGNITENTTNEVGQIPFLGRVIYIYVKQTLRLLGLCGVGRSGSGSDLCLKEVFRILKFAMCL